MDNVTGYVIGGVISLLVLFTLAPTLFDQWGEMGEEEWGDDGTQSIWELAPSGSEATLSAVLVIFFVLVLYAMYKESE